jgi:hypothetical protein
MITERKEVVDKDVASIERVMSPGEDMDKIYMNYDRVDPDVAKCKLSLYLTLWNHG